MKHSTEGKSLRDSIYKTNSDKKSRNADIKVKQLQEKMARGEGLGGDMSDVDEAEETQPDTSQIYHPHQNKKDYNEIFKGHFKAEKDIVRGPSVAKLRGDDITIMKSLIAKHEDDLGAMTKDIKLNYMQWSKSVVATKYKAYYTHNHHKTTQ